MRIRVPHNHMTSIDIFTPIFIIGSARSGTSIVRDGLVSGAGIQGTIEGCFIDMLGAFLQTVDSKFLQRAGETRKKNEMMLEFVSKDVFKDALVTWFLEQYKTYTPTKGMWVDKTPDNDVLPVLPYLPQHIPSAKIIFMKRRPLENMQSRLRKFPNRTFEQQCAGWAKIMHDFDAISPQLPEHMYMVIDQYDIECVPSQVAAQIGSFLNLSMSQVQQMQYVFERTRPEATTAKREIPLVFDELPWTNEQKQFFIETCGPLMERHGWSWDAGYYRS